MKEMKTRGFFVGRRVGRALRWLVRPRWRRARTKLGDRSSFFRNPMSKIESLARRLRSGGDYRRINEEEVPEGHLAVYVGEEFRRVVVPVIYFNHPLFGELLKEAEEVYGFDHRGGIAIPCRVSHFERVKTRIAAGHVSGSVDSGCRDGYLVRLQKTFRR